MQMFRNEYKIDRGTIGIGAEGGIRLMVVS